MSTWTRWAVVSGILTLAGAMVCESASAEVVQFDIPSEDAGKSIAELSRQAGVPIIGPGNRLHGVITPKIKGAFDVTVALEMMLRETGLKTSRSEDGIIVISPATKKNACDGDEETMSTHSKLLAGVSLIATAWATLQCAIAQDTAQPPQAPESVVITGTRLSISNASAPTPVTTFDSDQLNTMSPISLQDAVLKAPQFTATVSARTATHDNGRGWSTPTPAFNLYGLGAVRTLVLMDGNRLPASFYDGTTNIDMLPQMLVQRVDVVTGGASAVYGSDAVAGVVNFVLDHHFNGFKATAQGGISDYGDGASFRLGAAGGFDIFNRGHFEASAEYFNADAIPDSATRPYGLSSCNFTGTGSTATPYLLQCNTKQSSTSPNGLIVSGPMAGKQFSADGKSIVAFNPGTPTNSGGISVGGDGGVQSHENLTPTDHTFQSYARFDYDISDSLQAYVDARYASVFTKGASQGYTMTDAQYPLWIYSGNTFLTAAEQSALFPTGTTAVDVARFDNDLMRQLTIRQATSTWGVSVGLKGTAFGDFTWDAHYTHGLNHVSLATYNNLNTSRLYAALDAVKDPATGNNVCKVSLTAPGAFPGCVPINLFGQNNASRAAQDYVFGTTAWTAANSMDDVAGNLTGTVFKGWAGPIKAAVGVEYRSQGLSVTSTTPDDAFNPQYLRLGPNGNSAPGSYPGSNLAWFKEVQSPGAGSENISEADVELQVPLLSDLPFAKSVALNGAYRYTAYSASGEGAHSSFSANTWKIGLEWTLNDDVRFRMLESRDMRAPTLYDLYQQQEISSSGISDPLTGLVGSVNSIVGGNPNLKPEVSYNYTAGVVLTPSFVPGLTASLDYIHIKINNAIGGIGGLDPSIVALCQKTGAPQYCGLVVRPGAYNDPSPSNFPTAVYSVNSNVAMNEIEAWTAEVDYTTDLKTWTSVPGQVDLHLYYTYEPVNNSQSFRGAGITNMAGIDAVWAPTPTKHVVNALLQYSLDPIAISVNERFYKGGTQGPTAGGWGTYIPYGIADYWQTDLNMTYTFNEGDSPMSAFLNIQNLWNDKGPMTGGWTGSPGMLYPIPNYADAIGRYFTIGVRVNM